MDSYYSRNGSNISLGIDSEKDRRKMLFSSSSSSTQQWEESFSQILDRTRQNINKISQKYSSELSPIDPISKYTFQPPSFSSNNDYLPSSQYRPQRVGIKENIAPSIHSSNAALLSGKAPNVASDYSNSIHDSKLEERILNLEKMLVSLSEKSEMNNSANSSSINAIEIDRRLRFLETSVDSMRHSMESLAAEVKDSLRQSAQNNTSLMRQSTQLESHIQEYEIRRGSYSKIESWVRQTESWRNECDAKIDDITKEMKVYERISKEFQGDISDRVSKADIESLKDRLGIMAQQSVAVSMSVWHDKIESQLRLVERQLAAVRMGSSLPSGFTLANQSNVNELFKDRSNATLDMTNDEISQALSSPFPSELFVKSLIAAEVRELENSIEQKVIMHADSSIRGEVAESSKSVKAELRDYLGKIAAELGLTSKEGELEGSAAQVMTMRRGLERQVQMLTDKLDDISQAIIMLQENADGTEKNLRVDFRGLERRVEEAIAISTATVSTIQDRASYLDKHLAGVETSQRENHKEFRNEISDKLKAFNDQLTAERFELERRMLITEKTTESVLTQVALSKDMIEGFFATSPEVKRFETAAIKVEGIQVELKSLRSDIKEAVVSSSRVEATAAKQIDLYEITEKLSMIDGPVREKVRTSL
jgi:hypothetical protein